MLLLHSKRNSKGSHETFSMATSESLPHRTERLSIYHVYCHFRLLNKFEHKKVECTKCRLWYHVTYASSTSGRILFHWKCDKINIAAGHIQTCHTDDSKPSMAIAGIQPSNGPKHVMMPRSLSKPPNFLHTLADHLLNGLKAR